MMLKVGEFTTPLNPWNLAISLTRVVLPLAKFPFKIIMPFLGVFEPNL